MNFKRFHESKNLFPQNSFSGKSSAIRIQFNDVASGIVFDTGQYVFTTKISTELSSGVFKFCYTYTDDSEEKSGWVTKTTPSVTLVSNANKIIKSISITDYNSYGDITLSEIMLNTGSQPLPYEPYSSEVWHDVPYYIHNISTDTITTLPADIYANDTTATVGLKGQMQQIGTPTPTTPIQPSECGDLETEGAKAGQYKIPILNNSQTTNVYLGEVESTRKIKKLVLDGTENWLVESGVNGLFTLPNVAPLIQYNNQLCTHFSLASSYVNFYNTDLTFAVTTRPCLLIHYNACQTVSEFKTFLAAEYAAGHPVTIWYVLAEPTTGILNEPIRKIGTYADEVSGITIPTIAGANTISVDTTLQPSEVSVNYHGWHPVLAVHERENGAWT